AVVTGPAKPSYAIEPLAEGEYFFNCEIHPATMTGTMTAAPGGGEGGGEGVTVAAAALEFNTDTIELPADTPTTITFDNQEAGVPHNIAIYGDDSLGEVLFQGEVVTGPASVPYEVPALPEGEFFFQCDVHPTMTGTVVVAAGGGGGEQPPPDEGGGGEQPPPDEGGGGGGATATVAAENTAFNPATLSWAADTQIALTFDNRDPADVAGPHNVSIYDGDTAVFQGELVSGPATVEYAIPPMQPGTFEFRCDVHPEMIGTVEVT
ncbi:MAG TPA: cupredoxin domain-containing protein, partial [Actinomycetota bacterium]